MSTLTAYIAKLLLVPAFAGGLCMGALVQAPTAQAMMHDHAPVAEESTCCTVVHAAHETEVSAPEFSKMPVSSSATDVAFASAIVFQEAQTLSVPPLLLPGESLRLTGSIIKRE